MQVTKIKEDISISYISALCAYAGIAYEINRHDDDSTDGTLRKIVLLDGSRKFNAELRIQLKCTSSPSQYTDHGDNITYKLKVKNYNDLCLSATTPIILGLLVLPVDKNEWLKWSQEELLIKGCMYWKRFSSESASQNSEFVSVRIDKNNIINSESLYKMLEKIAKEEWT